MSKYAVERCNVRREGDAMFAGELRRVVELDSLTSLPKFAG